MSRDEVLKGWTTTQELEFIEHLSSRRTAVDLLRGYLEGMRNRVHFGTIDAARAIAAAQQYLKAVESRVASQR